MVWTAADALTRKAPPAGASDNSSRLYRDAVRPILKSLGSRTKDPYTNVASHDARRSEHVMRRSLAPTKQRLWRFVICETCQLLGIHVMPAPIQRRGLGMGRISVGILIVSF